MLFMPMSRLANYRSLSSRSLASASSRLVVSASNGAKLVQALPQFACDEKLDVVSLPCHCHQHVLQKLDGLSFLKGARGRRTGDCFPLSLLFGSMPVPACISVSVPVTAVAAIARMSS